MKKEFKEKTCKMINAILVAFVVFLSVYVGFVLCFVGGIWDIAVMIQESSFEFFKLVLAVFKIIFAFPIGVSVFALLAFIMEKIMRR